MSTFEEGFDVGMREAERHGLAPWPAWIHAYATGALFQWGFPERERPDIISGHRPPFRQRQLRNRWDAGDRSGLRVRPAERSHHSTAGASQAWDVEDGVAGFPWYRYVVMDWIRPRVDVPIRWGGNFSTPDTVHFDVPIIDPPPSIYSA